MTLPFPINTKSYKRAKVISRKLFWLNAIDIYIKGKKIYIFNVTFLEFIEICFSFIENHQKLLINVECSVPTNDQHLN